MMLLECGEGEGTLDAVVAAVEVNNAALKCEAGGGKRSATSGASRRRR